MAWEYVDVPEEERGEWDDEDWNNYHAEVEAGGLKPTKGDYPIVDQVHDEFNDWWDNGGTPGEGYDPDHLYEEVVNRGPIGHWPTVENFLKDRYPAAYRGLGYGYEEAKAILDNEGEIYRPGESDLLEQPKPYETGQEPLEQYGYDSKEIASAVMYLHNLSRGIGGNYDEHAGEDGARLWNIYQKRQQMQHNYESRTARRLFLAMAWEDYKGKIQGGCRSCTDGWEGRYTVPQAGAFLNYTHGNHLGKPAVHVQGIYTHPSSRNDGVAEALMRRLAEDHPGVPINPGYMTPDGQNFHDKMLEKEPTARDLVTAAIRLLEM